MLFDEGLKNGSVDPILSRKSEILRIETLHARIPHMVKDKLSDKFNRKDMQFYDLYVT